MYRFYFPFTALLFLLLSCSNNEDRNAITTNKSDKEEDFIEDSDSWVSSKDSIQKRIDSASHQTTILNWKLIKKKTMSFNCKDLKNVGDCKNAIIIFTSKFIDFNCTPLGYGNVLEFEKNNSKSLHFFEREHNTIWLKFKSPYDGLLAFDLIPKNKEYDYDFSLYKSEENNICDVITKKKLLPIRTNISKNNKFNNSTTGLSFEAKKHFVNSGIGDSYSSALKVKRGDFFYLVIDNIYGGEDGFSLDFKYQEIITLSGVVKDGDKILEADISIENTETGEIIATSTSNPTSGKYEIEIPLLNVDRLTNFTITFFKEKHFFSEVNINVDKLKKLNNTPLNIALDKLKKGKKMKINNINFYGGKAIYLPSAKSSLKNLKKLMQVNSNLKIQIEGHVNGCDNDPKGDSTTF